mmetsp:Transcript_27241/g.63489  ORF Transcript_27241/g.63489 Transcript_27241/m.63489 type:complete len:264 (-) Transcript_27241:834-1625(-)
MPSGSASLSSLSSSSISWARSTYLSSSSSAFMFFFLELNRSGSSVLSYFTPRVIFLRHSFFFCLSMVFFFSTFSCRRLSWICFAKSSSSCVKASSSAFPSSSAASPPCPASLARKLEIALSRSASPDPPAAALPGAPTALPAAAMPAEASPLPATAGADPDLLTITPCFSASICAFCASRSCFSRCLRSFIRHLRSSVRSRRPNTFRSSHKSRMFWVVSGSAAMISPPGASRLSLCDLISIFAGSSVLMKSCTGTTLKSSPSS